MEEEGSGRWRFWETSEREGEGGVCVVCGGRVWRNGGAAQSERTVHSEDERVRSLSKDNGEDGIH